MTHSAQVTSIAALTAFRGTLCTFQEQAGRALLAIDEQSLRALHWLENDAPAYWRGQVRRWYDEVARTRVALETARRQRVGDYRPACQEEQAAYRHAQQKLREAEDKIEIVRRWAQRVRDEFDEYRGRVGRLRDALEGGVPRSLALLDRTTAALDSYLERTATPAPADDTAAGPLPNSPP